MVKGANEKIAVIGLGYVGLPLALALARSYPVTGFDISTSRIAELRGAADRSGEVDAAMLRASTMTFTDKTGDIEDANVYIVTVPTPVDAENKPDLGALTAACGMIGRILKRGDTVVFESTVYPGITEDFCGPTLEAASNLVCGEDFFLGYSPERINPGDKKYTVDKITKVVSGQTPGIAARLAEIYGHVTNGNIFVAKDIRTAEAAKVIENAQRDINIAFVNELAMICNKVGLSTHDVLAAAQTKWNFLPFTPGLVGGHCIGVDPYYLAHLSRSLGHEPEVILSGRRINEGMSGFIADQIDKHLGRKPSRVLVLGLTFKENVPDLRNSKSADLVRQLAEKGHHVDVHDPCADPEEAKTEYGLDLHPVMNDIPPADCIVGAVRHEAYCDFTSEVLSAQVVADGLIADLKGMWRHIDMPDGIRRWNL
ncbi:MAG: nucleotide sugar dehydrogenase [Rhodospirillales bacterium]|nr:nucleotide sugar dehydrogenase [Rhodospirillales bacterium]MBO6787749.1 nucleotide sugar dehydrogenase [Rhodospirillales bacterium]